MDLEYNQETRNFISQFTEPTDSLRDDIIRGGLSKNQKILKTIAGLLGIVLSVLMYYVYGKKQPDFNTEKRTIGENWDIAWKNIKTHFEREKDIMDYLLYMKEMFLRNLNEGFLYYKNKYDDDDDEPSFNEFFYVYLLDYGNKRILYNVAMGIIKFYLLFGKNMSWTIEYHTKNQRKITKNTKRNYIFNVLPHQNILGNDESEMDYYREDAYKFIEENGNINFEEAYDEKFGKMYLNYITSNNFIFKEDEFKKLMGENSEEEKKKKIHSFVSGLPTTFKSKFIQFIRPIQSKERSVDEIITYMLSNNIKYSRLIENIDGVEYHFNPEKYSGGYSYYYFLIVIIIILVILIIFLILKMPIVLSSVYI